MSAAADSALAWAKARTQERAVPYQECLAFLSYTDGEGNPAVTCTQRNPRAPDFYGGSAGDEPMSTIVEPAPLELTLFGGFTGGFGSIAPAYIRGQLAEVAVSAGLPRSFDWTAYLAQAAREHFEEYRVLYSRYETAYAYPIHMAITAALADHAQLATAAERTGYGSEFWAKLEAWRATVKRNHESANRNAVLTLIAVVAAPFVAMYFAPAAPAAAGAGGATGAGAGGIAELGLVADAATAEAAIAGGIEAGTLAGGAGAITLGDVAALELASSGSTVAPAAPASTAPAAPGALEQAAQQVVKAGTTLAQNVLKGLLGTAAARLVNGAPENEILPQETGQASAPGAGLGGLILPAALLVGGLILKG